MLCPANTLGYLHAIRLAQTGASCGVRELAPAVCRLGLPGRAPRINFGALTPDWYLCFSSRRSTLRRGGCPANMPGYLPPSAEWLL